MSHGVSSLSLLLLLQWLAVVKGQGSCPDCDSTLVMAACRALNLNDPGSRLPCCTPLSCMDIHRCNPSASSGYYRIQTANGSLVQVYCDMEGTNCGGEGGWTRVFQLNATDPSSQCPTGFSLTAPNGVSVCTRTDSAPGCTGTSTDSIPHSYTQVCGFVRGYSIGGTDAFGAFGRTSSEPLTGNYVDGVSITYGTAPLNHLWTYAAGNSETGGGTQNCPCNTNSTTSPIPSYVGNDYYCEARSGSDPLWDGMQCGGDEGPCCTNNPTLPWFIRNTLSPTDDDIMIRICNDEGSSNEDIGLELVEIYVR